MIKKIFCFIGSLGASLPWSSTEAALTEYFEKPDNSIISIAAPHNGLLDHDLHDLESIDESYCIQLLGQFEETIIIDMSGCDVIDIPDISDMLLAWNLQSDSPNR